VPIDATVIEGVALWIDDPEALILCQYRVITVGYDSWTETDRKSFDEDGSLSVDKLAPQDHSSKCSVTETTISRFPVPVRESPGWWIQLIHSIELEGRFDCCSASEGSSSKLSLFLYSHILDIAMTGPSARTSYLQRAYLAARNSLLIMVVDVMTRGKVR